MEKFIVEILLPGAGNLSPEELKAISQTSLEIADGMDERYYWIQSLETDDNI